MKLTLGAFFIPLLTSLALLQLRLFFSYPSFQVELWVSVFIFSLPMTFLGLMYLLRNRSALAVKSCDATRPEMFFTKRTNIVFLVLSLIYVGFMFYRYLIIGSVMTDGITGARYAEIYAGPGRGGIITGVTTLTAGAPIFLLLAQIERAADNRSTSPLVWALALIGLFSTFLSGGRNAFLINVIFLLMAGHIWQSLSLSYALNGKNLKRVALRIIIYLVFLGGVAYSLYIFVERGRLRSEDLIVRAIIMATESDFLFDPSNIPSWMPQELYFSLASLHNYLTLGFFYFDRLLLSGLDNGHLGGSYNFFIFYLIIDKLLGTSFAVNLSTDLPIIGAYYTLPGSIYVDFGTTGLLVCAFALPVLTIFFVGEALKGGRTYLPVAALSLTVLALAPLYNASALASGPSLLTISVVFLALRRRRTCQFSGASKSGLTKSVSVREQRE